MIARLSKIYHKPTTTNNNNTTNTTIKQRHLETLISMYFSSTRHSLTFIIIWNVYCFFNFFFGICFIIKCLFLCVTECWSMYLCDFHYECVRIRTPNCAFFAVLAFLSVILICLARRTLASITSDAKLHRHRHRRPLKNGWISHFTRQQQQRDGQTRRGVLKVKSYKKLPK